MKPDDKKLIEEVRARLPRLGVELGDDCANDIAETLEMIEFYLANASEEKKANA